MHSFKYSIIKYSPDSLRGEVLNVGLIVFGPGKADIRIISNPTKARIIDGRTTIDDLQSLKEGLQELTARSTDPQDAFLLLNSFGKTSSWITDPAVFVIDDLSQYEKRVSNLFDKLVKPYSTRESRAAHARFQTQIKNKFEALGLLGKDTDDLSKHKVIANYPISEKTGFTADFLIKNGRYHITGAVDFNVHDLNAKFKETSMKVMAFMEGKKHLDDTAAGYFVYMVDAKKEADIAPHLNLAEEYCDRLFNLSSASEKTAYFELMHQLAGAPQLLH